MTHFLERRAFVETTNAANAQANGILMMLDGDNFSQISKRYGAFAAELAIQAVETAVIESMRDGDVVSYLGKDRFVVFAKDAKLAEGQQIADRIRAAVATATFEPEHGIIHQLTISVGAVVAAQKQDADRLIMLANSCLDHAKRNGRNTVVMKTYFRADDHAQAA